MKNNTKYLPVQLSEAEIKVKGEELAKAIDSHTKLEDEKKQVTGDYSKQLKVSGTKIRLIAKIVETGKEHRDVPVKTEYFPSKNLAKIYRNDTGELVEARSMTPEEYQLEFFDDEDEVILSDKNYRSEDDE